jgi:hypothetical protein
MGCPLLRLLLLLLLLLWWRGAQGADSRCGCSRHRRPPSAASLAALLLLAAPLAATFATAAAAVLARSCIHGRGRHHGSSSHRWAHGLPVVKLLLPLLLLLLLPAFLLLLLLACARHPLQHQILLLAVPQLLQLPPLLLARVVWEAKQQQLEPFREAGGHALPCGALPQHAPAFHEVQVLAGEGNGGNSMVSMQV